LGAREARERNGVSRRARKVKGGTGRKTEVRSRGASQRRIGTQDFFPNVNFLQVEPMIYGLALTVTEVTIL
jgi:hypothetical protein